MKTIKDYKDYTGLDVDLETSLFEYGLIWKKEDDRYRFVYGVGADSECNYNLFDWGTMSKADYLELIAEDWIDIKGVCGFLDTDLDGLKADFPYAIDGLIGYYGHENIFGSSYYPFEIKEEE